MAAAIQPPAYVLQAEEPAWQIISGGSSFSDGEYNYFTAWLDMPNGRQTVCRLVVPLHVARKVSEQASREWNKGKH